MPIRRTRRGRTAFRVVALAFLVAGSDPAAARCPERPACRGCGCKGGPGYRAPDGGCVGFRELEKVCGPSPHARCRFENAPGTGGNRDCALPKSRRPAAES